MTLLLSVASRRLAPQERPRPEALRTYVALLPHPAYVSGRGDLAQRLRVEILFAATRALIDGNIVDGQPLVELDGHDATMHPP